VVTSPICDAGACHDCRRARHATGNRDHETRAVRLPATGGVAAPGDQPGLGTLDACSQGGVAEERQSFGFHHLATAFISWHPTDVLAYSNLPEPDFMGNAGWVTRALHRDARRHSSVSPDRDQLTLLPSCQVRTAVEPALAAYAARKQAEHIDRFTALLAERLRVDPVRDMRPRLVVSTSMAAATAAWSAWLAQPRSDLLALVTLAHDLLDEGLTTI
jgi:hypothetical protein